MYPTGMAKRYAWSWEPKVLEGREGPHRGGRRWAGLERWAGMAGGERWGE